MSWDAPPRWPPGRHFTHFLASQKKWATSSTGILYRESQLKIPFAPHSPLFCGGEKLSQTFSESSPMTDPWEWFTHLHLPIRKNSPNNKSKSWDKLEVNHIPKLGSMGRTVYFPTLGWYCRDQLVGTNLPDSHQNIEVTSHQPELRLKGISWVDLPPSQDASHKWRFRLGFPTKKSKMVHVILVVTSQHPGGVDLRITNILTLLPRRFLEG